jgi:hypothetical protein
VKHCRIAPFDKDLRLTAERVRMIQSPGTGSGNDAELKIAVGFSSLQYPFEGAFI